MAYSFVKENVKASLSTQLVEAEVRATNKSKQ